jgi:DNA recombination protein RmuC
MDSTWGWALAALVVLAALAWAGWMHRIAAAERRAAASLVDQLRAQLAQASTDAARLPDAIERATRAEAELARVGTAGQEAAARLAGIDAQATALAAERDRLVAQLEAARAEFARLSTAHAQVEARCEATEAAHAQTRQYLQDAEARLRTVFIEAASKVFDEKSLALDQRIQASGDASRQGLEATLKPFAERIGQFQQKVEQLGTEQARDHARLVGTITELKTLNQGMADATSGLARALKGNAKSRGDWGELILETVLKASGLEEGRNYSAQASSTDEDTGERRRPDVIVHLPDGRQVVVDSKVNLVAWSEYTDAGTTEAAQEALVRHAAALLRHVRDLEAKNYPRVLGPSALDLTILFVPIEGALAAALALNPDLQTDAFKRRIVFASPNTLMAMLRVVERLWLRDKVQKQVDTIGVEAGKLMDALVNFLGDFDVIEGRIEDAHKAFRRARNTLQESPQSVVARGRRLVEAGAKGKKAIPEELQPTLETPLLPLGEDASEADAPGTESIG